jgi:hypothetical protein
MDANSSQDDLKQLARDVADLRVVVRVMLAVVLAGISYFSIKMFFAIPRFEKIFGDMLGDRNKLPEVTKLVIEWGRLGLLPLVLLSGLSAAGFLLLATQRNVRIAGFGFVISAVPLLMHLLVCWSALLEPLLSVIRGLSGSEY